MTNIPKSIIEEVRKIQENFLWNKKNLKIKHSTLIGEYEWGGLKKVDVDTKLRSIKISWLRRLFDNNYHPWKIIPLKMIEQYDKSLGIFLSQETTNSVGCPHFILRSYRSGLKLQVKHQLLNKC